MTTGYKAVDFGGPPSLSAGADVHVFPTSFAQQRLWLLEQMDPGNAVYNVPVARRVRGPLDAGALRIALRRLRERHEVLRTTFESQGGEPVQVVAGLDAAELPLPVVDLTEFPGDAIAEAERLAAVEAATPFDLARGPLVRAGLIRIAPDDHIFLLTIHHIVTDGWSKGILFRELDALYAAARGGVAPALPVLPIQYADYAIWQRDALQGPALERMTEFWRTRLRPPPPPLELPTSQPRPAAPSHRGEFVRVEIPAADAAAMSALCRVEGASLFMGLLAAFKVLLFRHAGTADLVVGTPIAGRAQRETEPLIGLFVNTVPLRTSLDGEPTFRELLARVRDSTLDGLAHAELPFEMIVEAVQPPRDHSRHPIFQTMFALQNVPPGRFELFGLSTEPVSAVRETTKFDLMLGLAERGGALQGSFSYSTDLFDAETVGRLAAHFVAITHAAVADPDQSIARIPMLPDAERNRMITEWNDTDAGYPVQATIHGLFEAQVRRAPDAIAVSCGTERLSYGELNRRANQVAWALRRNGISPDDMVAVCLERSVGMIVAILGILKAGGAYVPLDPAQPDQRLAFMLSDCGASVLVTESRLRGRLASPGLVTMLLDDTSALARERADDPPPAAMAANLSYVIYTSGSTGRPKGVLIEHRNVVRLLFNDRFQFDFSDRDVWTVFHSFAFDFSVWEMYGALLYGGRLIVVPKVIAQSPRQYLDLLRSEGVTVLNQTPSAFQALMAEEMTRPKHDLGLRYVIFGGEALSPGLLRPWRTAYPGTRLINMFGITETTVHVTYKELDDAAINSNVSNVGRPIPTLSLYVLDTHLQPVPIGATGEICVGGAGVARGYLNRDALTAERFVPSPFRPRERLYRSGDLGRFRPDGEVEYLGRRDAQVKIRGFRIELGEIEAALAEHPEVQAAVATTVPDAAGDPRLVAYVVSRTGLPPAATELQAALRRRLPEYMVPSTIVSLNAVPLTANGKVDRRALPDPDVAALASQRASAPPRSPLEFELIQLWQRMLDVRPIGIRDDFFDLGGHSLLAARLMREIELMTGRALPLAVLFSGATIEHVAAELIASQRATADGPLIVVRAGHGRRPLFFMHGDVIGGGLYCEAVGRTLHPDQPLLVLPPHGPGGPDTIEDMADDYLRIVRARQPHGPYRLGGFCNGGLVAFEMARRLHADGELVELLFLVDSVGANARFRSLEPVLRVLAARHSSRTARLDARAAAMVRLRKLWALGNRVRRMNVAEFAALLGRAARRQAARATGRLNGRAGSVKQPRVRTVPEADIPTLEFIGRASRMYIPRPYDGEIHSVWAIGNRPRPTDPTRGWRRVARRVHPYLIPVSHNAVATSHVPELLRACLEQLDRES